MLPGLIITVYKPLYPITTSPAASFKHGSLPSPHSGLSGAISFHFSWPDSDKYERVKQRLGLEDKKDKREETRKQQICQNMAYLLDLFYSLRRKALVCISSSAVFKSKPKSEALKGRNDSFSYRYRICFPSLHFSSEDQNLPWPLKPGINTTSGKTLRVNPQSVWPHPNASRK